MIIVVFNTFKTMAPQAPYTMIMLVKMRPFSKFIAIFMIKSAVSPELHLAVAR
jgi:hypothetical protein